MALCYSSKGDRIRSPSILQSNQPYNGGRISTRLKSNLSLVGAVSLMVTVVPLSGVTLFCRCTQYVLPTLVKN